MAHYAYIVQVIASGLRSHVALNGWRACLVDDPRRRVSQSKVNAWIVEGTNRLELVAAPFGDEGPPAGAALELWLYKTQADTRTSEDDPILRYRWTPEESPLHREGPTVVLRHELEVARAFGRWAWEDATPYMPENRDEVLAVVHRLYQALAARDLGSAERLLARRVDEYGRAHGYSPQGAADEHRTMLQGMLSAPDWAVAPPDYARLAIETDAGGRLARVQGPSGSPALRCRAHGKPAGVLPVLSRIRGEWEIIR